jgi:LacI family transcriptional regulator
LFSKTPLSDLQILSLDFCSVNRFTKAIHMRGRNITIKDVAKAAGFSPTAVSRYLNRDIILPASSAARIDEAILFLDYRPNHLARNLSLGKSHIIGLIIPEISNPFFASLASAVEDVAFAANYGVVVCNTHNDAAREFSYLRLLSSHQLDGIVLLTCQSDNLNLLSLLGESHRVVLVDEDVEGVIAPRVFSENRVGGYLATKHLVEYGHRSIGFIGGPERLLSSRERFAGFASVLSECNTPIQPCLVRFGPYTTNFGREIARELLRKSNPPTAIFATSDYVALGVLHAATDLGISVPRDLSLVGFDDMPFAAFLSPPLTTVRQPIRELGESGANLLFSLINGTPPAMAPLRLPVELIERGSVQRILKRRRAKVHE